ncbi:MAG: SpaA isopeptide-forming pilin-related protein, partial [Oscillospiraceae bacterium]|nr:SpaA isopeptide-forming pilin-related protein [Oscillospiraceae bacterium]
FDDAYDNMGFDFNDNMTDKYLFLITDGAPQGGSKPNNANQAPSTQEAYDYAVDSAEILSDQGVKIASIGLGTNRVLNAHNLFAEISYTPEGKQQMEYQATDGAKLKNALYYAVMQALTDLTVIGDVTDTIDSAFYPVSTNGTPLEPGDWINLSGVKMTDHTSSTAHGVIGKDNNGDWTVTWESQDITWPNSSNPEGWHGKVHVKAKEDFLGGNTIPTNEHASIEAKKLKDPKTGTTYNFNDLYNPSDDSLSTNPVEPESPYVNVDELYIPPQTTEWTVYLGTEVDPLTQMKEMYKNTNVYEVVKQESQDHRMVSPSDMVYTLTNGNTDFVKMNAVADNRQVNGERNPVPLSYYLINCTEEAEDLTDEEWQILISGGKVSRRYLEYDHEPGTIELTLTTEGGSYDIHEANTVGTGVEKYYLNVLYKPDPAVDINYHIGSYRTLQSGLASGNISRQLKHIINVIKRIITVKKTKSDNTDLDGATFKIYQKDDSDNEINVVTLTGGTAVWDYVLPDEDQKVPGDYWKDSTTWYLKEESAPEGYAKYDEEIEFQIDISDTKTDLPPANNNNAALYTWVQAASLSIVSTMDSDYVSVIGDSDITISVKNDKSIDIVVIKTDINGDLIPGAQFTLTKGSALVTDIKVIKKNGSWDNESDRIAVENGVFTIPAGGVTILGLGAGEYTLTETKAPDGYIKTIQPVKFTAGRDGTVTYTNAADNPAPKVLSVNENKQYTIQNEPGASLPSTGGFGTTMIYILGSILTFGAGVLLWRRRRLI